MSRAMVKGDNGKFEDRTFEVLHDAVVAHYTRLGFYDHATALVQQCYALTEAGETTKAVLVNDLPEIKDGIGDILICLINWAQLESVDFMQEYGEAKILCVSRLSPAEAVILTHHEISNIGGVDVELYDLIETLHILAARFDLTLADCLGCAYDVISKRKVKLLNGTLVKEANWYKHPELEDVAEL